MSKEGISIPEFAWQRRMPCNSVTGSTSISNFEISMGQSSIAKMIGQLIERIDRIEKKLEEKA